MSKLITKHFEIKHDFAYVPGYVDGPKWVGRKTLHVFVYAAGPYNETVKLRAFHKCKRCWSACEAGRETVVSGKRTKQIEAWLKLIGAKSEVTVQDT